MAAPPPGDLGVRLARLDQGGARLGRPGRSTGDSVAACSCARAGVIGLTCPIAELRVATGAIPATAGIPFREACAHLLGRGVVRASRRPAGEPSPVTFPDVIANRPE